MPLGRKKRGRAEEQGDMGTEAGMEDGVATDADVLRGEYVENGVEGVRERDGDEGFYLDREAWEQLTGMYDSLGRKVQEIADGLEVLRVVVAEREESFGRITGLNDRTIRLVEGEHAQKLKLLEGRSAAAAAAVTEITKGLDEVRKLVYGTVETLKSEGGRLDRMETAQRKMREWAEKVSPVVKDQMKRINTLWLKATGENIGDGVE